jgi:hypothetical protein
MQRNRTFDGCDPKVPPLPLHRLPHALPITAGSSAMANVTVRWNPCAPVMRTRNPPLNGRWGVASLMVLDGVCSTAPARNTNTRTHARSLELLRQIDYYYVDSPSSGTYPGGPVPPVEVTAFAGVGRITHDSYRADSTQSQG